jgi:hypothetical protein
VRTAILIGREKQLLLSLGNIDVRYSVSLMVACARNEPNHRDEVQPRESHQIGPRARPNDVVDTSALALFTSQGHHRPGGGRR